MKSICKEATSISCTTDACELHTGDSVVAITGHFIQRKFVGQKMKWLLHSVVLGLDVDNGAFPITRFYFV